MKVIESYLSKSEQISILNKYNVKNIALHQQKVAYYALELFDYINKYYTFTKEHRDILYYSALFHDIGYFISKKSHHKYTGNLILKEPILYKMPDDIKLLISLIASCHGKSIDSRIKFYSHEIQLSILQLIALLRIADVLDHTHKLKISLEKIQLKDEIFTLSINGENISKIINKFQKKSLLFEEVFNIPIKLEYPYYNFNYI
ncbi:HD domain-containing protein [Clostridium sp.]|jgi:exopolyphosphatase/guanosine-5'-triphosphate,3'-diphosphate pyrophosphatase|uniref:HD domain-containing protein n=1 Tax=Clostridium sp. TaxID=1506 RepID=UPI002FDCD011